jgi:hypothetical protein
MNLMLEVTPAACKYLSSRLAESPNDVCFVLEPVSTGDFALRMKRAQMQDTLIRYNGDVILAIAARVVPRLNGWLLDIDSRATADANLVLMRAPREPRLER